MLRKEVVHALPSSHTETNMALTGRISIVSLQYKLFKAYLDIEVLIPTLPFNRTKARLLTL